MRLHRSRNQIVRCRSPWDRFLGAIGIPMPDTLEIDQLTTILEAVQPATEDIGFFIGHLLSVLRLISKKLEYLTENILRLKRHTAYNRWYGRWYKVSGDDADIRTSEKWVGKGWTRE